MYVNVNYMKVGIIQLVICPSKFSCFSHNSTVHVFCVCAYVLWVFYVTGLGSFLSFFHSFYTLSASVLHTCIFIYIYIHTCIHT